MRLMLGVGMRYVETREKSPRSTSEMPLKLANWSVGEDSGILGVGVTSVDIWRNISGEGYYLAHN